MKEIREKILRYGSFGLVFLLPILYWAGRVYPHISSKIFFLNGVVEILAGVWIYSLLVEPAYRISKKTLLYLLPLFGFLAWMTLAGIMAVNPHLSFWSSLARGTGLIMLYHSFVFALIVVSLIKRHGTTYLYSFLEWFVWGGLVLALSVWFGSQGFNAFHFLQNDGGGGLMGNSSLAAAYLVFVVAFSLYLLTLKILPKSKKVWMWITIALTLLSSLFIDLHGALTGQSLLGNARGAVLGILVGVGAACIGYLLLSTKKVLRIIGVVGLVAGLVVFIVGWKQLITPNTSLHNAFTSSATGTRFIFWNTAERSIQEHPWFGYGPENYMIAFQHNFDPKMLLKENNNESWNDRAHNIYYDLGVSGGYPAIAFYGLFITSILYALYRVARNGAITQIQFATLGGLVVAYVFQNLFVFDSALSWTALFILAGIVYSFANNQPKTLHEQVLLNPLLKKSIAVVLVLLFGMSWVYLAYMPARKAHAYAKVLGMPVNTRADHYKDLLQGSRVGNDWDASMFADGLYKVYAANPSKAKNDIKNLPALQKDLNSLIQYLEEVAKQNPNDYRLYISLVHLYSTSFYFSDTAADPVLGAHMFELLDHAHTLSPTNPNVYWSMAQLYVWKGDLGGATKAYKDAIAIDPTIPASHTLLIQFAQVIGDKKLYEESVADAKKYGIIL